MEESKLSVVTVRRVLKDLVASEVNARRMPGQAMRHLTENLRRDGVLSSAPLVYGDRIISGHHRVEAAIKAGIVEADCLSIEGEVDEGRLTAIQLSHNSLAGEDDPEMLRQMLESLMPLEQAYAAVLDMEVPKPPPLRPSIGTLETLTVAVTFTPSDAEEIRRVADSSLFAQIEPLEQMRDFLEAVFAVKLQTTSTNRLGKAGVLTTMAQLSQWALENGYLDEGAGGLPVKPSGDQSEEPGAAPGPRSTQSGEDEPSDG